VSVLYYICVWFELKFSTGQVTPKPDGLVENWTHGNPIDGWSCSETWQTFV